MGVKLGDIIPPESVQTVQLSDLSGKAIAIDGYNILYQFLSTIRGPDGRPLQDRKGRVTSHLSGLFFRTINFLKSGIKVVYVFDGQPPQLKIETVRKRIELREKAKKMYEEALAAGEVAEARKYAAQAATLEKYMVETAIRLLDSLGVPSIIAPSEGEAQAAYMAMRGDAWASASQDFDSILFGTPRLVRNLSIVGRRKLPRKDVYITVEPEVVYTDKLFQSLGVGRKELVDMAILIGTDYFDGVKGIGPKRAYELIKEHGAVEKVLEAINKTVEVDVEAVRKLFLEPEVKKDYKLVWRDLNREAVLKLLCDEHDFSPERVEKEINELEAVVSEKRKETSLDRWLS
ncbi:MAG: flap endonuclease-1 [Nitrososphaerota archaeon]|nr:flap endonuclease-1 [Candidatus Calditenuaceae archaeon]MDW8072902.1 flap endonuclease-1 [Nitrososphaerota archaeon]